MQITEPAARQRLDALSCPFLDTLDLSDPLHHQKLICWLEDTHIRLLPVQDRLQLRLSTFRAFLPTYLRPLSIPPADDLCTVLHALVDLALFLHHSDHRARYNTPLDPWHGRPLPVIPASATDPAVLRAVAHLAANLGLPPVTDASDAARVAAAIVDACLTRDHPPDGSASDEEAYSLDQIPLGFHLDSPVVEKYARVVRVLQTRQLRELQDAINLTIAHMQHVTADPKTDARLGKVGR